MRFEKPKVGTITWKKKFAFLPKEFDKVTIWLEFYYSKTIIKQATMMGFPIINANGMGTIGPDIPYGDPYSHTTYHLKDSQEVKEYLLSQTPLSKALNEKE